MQIIVWKGLKFNICDYNDAYILLRGVINIIGHTIPHVAFKNYAPLTRFITKIDGITTDDAETLDLVMPM